MLSLFVHYFAPADVFFDRGKLEVGALCFGLEGVPLSCILTALTVPEPLLLRALLRK